MAEQKYRKALNFDLDTEKLRARGFKDTRPAYTKIRGELESLGFEHRQYSGYVSVNPLMNKDVLKAINIIAHKLPWLPQCVQKFDVTNIGKQYDLTNALTATVKDVSV